MRLFILISLATGILPLAEAQDMVQDAPLEFIRPSAVPLKIKKTPPLKRVAPPLPDPRERELSSEKAAPQPRARKSNFTVAPDGQIIDRSSAPMPAATEQRMRPASAESLNRPAPRAATPTAEPRLAPTQPTESLSQNPSFRPAAAAVVPSEPTQNPAPRPMDNVGAEFQSPAPMAAPAPAPERERVRRERPRDPSSLDYYSVGRPKPIVDEPADPFADVAPAKTAQPMNRKVTRKKITRSVSSEAPVKKKKSGGRKQALKNFRVANIWAMKDGTKSGSFILSWDPVILPVGRLNFGLSLGATMFESESVPTREASNFWVYEYGVSVSYYISRTFLPEVIIGAQTWNDDGATTNMMTALNLNFLFRERPMHVLDRLYVGYAAVQMDAGTTNVIRGGLGFRF